VHEKPIGDFTIAQAVGHEGENLDLPARHHDHSRNESAKRTDENSPPL
jgi:hypothetical protein